jgi:hypothetical protein
MSPLQTYQGVDPVRFVPAAPAKLQRCMQMLLKSGFQAPWRRFPYAWLLMACVSAVP